MGGLGKTVGVVLLVLMFLASGLAPAFAADNTAENIGKLKIKKLDKIEQKFIKLYSKDKEFKEDVNRIRWLILEKEELTEADWQEFKKRFNRILMKLYGKRADEKAFVAFREVVKAEAKKAKAYAYYREKAAQSMEISSTATSSIALAYLPRLYQPAIDINNGNSLIDTYAKVFDERIYGYSLPGKYIIEVTFVFADEDHPNSILDRMYDALRLTTWGRIEDLETFFIVVDKQTWTSEKLSFIKLWLLRYVEGVRKVLNVSACYSGDETWNTFIGSHLRAKITTLMKYYQALDTLR